MQKPTVAQPPLRCGYKIAPEISRRFPAATTLDLFRAHYWENRPISTSWRKGGSEKQPSWARHVVFGGQITESFMKIWNSYRCISPHYHFIPRRQMKEYDFLMMHQMRHIPVTDESHVKSIFISSIHLFVEQRCWEATPLMPTRFELWNIASQCLLQPDVPSNIYDIYDCSLTAIAILSSGHVPSFTKLCF